MAYSEAALARAQRALKQQQSDHRERQAALRREIFERFPQAAELDRQLRRTAPRILAASLRQGLEGQEALRALREENLARQDQLAALLDQAGYPADALDDPPFCPACGDRGWRGPAMCSCLETLCRREQVRDLSSLLELGEQSFDTFRLDYYDREIWPDKKTSPRENMESVLSYCRNYAEFFGVYPNKNLFFYGNPGLGKTFLSACIARTVAEQGHSVVYDTASNLFAAFEARKFGRDGEAGDQVRRYLSCELLILDDLGSEFTTPFVHAALYEVVNTRLAQGQRTVISSNLNMPAIRQRYTPQLASRLEGEYLFLPFFGQDIRLLKKGQR